MDHVLSALYLAPLLVSLVGPGVVVVCGARPRWAFAVAFAPLCLVLIATLASAPTHWGHAKATGSDDLENTGALIYLAFYALCTGLVGVAAGVVAWGGRRRLLGRAAGR
jgi:hypothetical protein